MNVNLLTVENAKALIKECLKEVLMERGMLCDKSKRKRVVSIDELLEAYPQWKRSTIYSWTSNDRIPHAKRFGRLYFDLDEIEEWILNS